MVCVQVYSGLSNFFFRRRVNCCMVLQSCRLLSSWEYARFPSLGSCHGTEVVLISGGY